MEGVGSTDDCPAVPLPNCECMALFASSSAAFCAFVRLLRGVAILRGVFVLEGDAERKSRVRRVAGGGNILSCPETLNAGGVEILMCAPLSFVPKSIGAGSSSATIHGFI